MRPSTRSPGKNPVPPRDFLAEKLILRGHARPDNTGENPGTRFRGGGRRDRPARSQDLPHSKEGSRREGFGAVGTGCTEHSPRSTLRPRRHGRQGSYTEATKGWSDRLRPVSHHSAAFSALSALLSSRISAGREEYQPRKGSRSAKNHFNPSLLLLRLLCFFVAILVAAGGRARFISGSKELARETRCCGIAMRSLACLPPSCAPLPPAVAWISKPDPLSPFLATPFLTVSDFADTGAHPQTDTR